MRELQVGCDGSNWTWVAGNASGNNSDYQNIKAGKYMSDISAGADKYPTPSAVHTTSSSNWFWTGGMTMTGDNSTKSINYSPWLVDQYGVKWVHGTITHGYYLTNYGDTAISGTSTTAYGDVKINSDTGVVSSNTGGYCAGGNKTRQIKAKVWFKADNVTAYSVEDYFTITYTQYTATYKYYTTTTESAPSIKSGSGKLRQAPAAEPSKKEAPGIEKSDTAAKLYRKKLHYGECRYRGRPSGRVKGAAKQPLFNAQIVLKYETILFECNGFYACKCLSILSTFSLSISFGTG